MANGGERAAVEPTTDDAIAVVGGLDDDALVALAHAVIDRLADVRTTDHRTRVRELTRLATRVEALLTIEVGELDRTLEHQLDGRRSATAWIAEHTNTARCDAGRIVRRARHLRELPVFAPLHLAGLVSTRHVELAVTARKRLRADDRFAEHEPRLARIAHDHGPERLADELSRLETVVECERDEPADPGAAWDTGNHLDHAEVLDGIGVLDGRFGPDGYAIVERAIRVQRDRAHTVDDPRSPAQQRGDALVGICQAYLRGNVGGTHRAHVLYHVDAPTWTGTAVGRSHTDRNVRVAPEAIRRHACDADIARVVVDAAGHVLDHGRSVRRFTPAQTRALMVTYPTCAFPGCAIPSSECEMHHVVWVEHGGPTDLANGAPLCYLHHHHVHEGRWTLARRADGTLEWRRADGTVHGTTRPSPPVEPMPLRRPPDPAATDPPAPDVTEPAPPMPAEAAPAPPARRHDRRPRDPVHQRIDDLLIEYDRFG